MVEAIILLLVIGGVGLLIYVFTKGDGTDLRKHYSGDQGYLDAKLKEKKSSARTGNLKQLTQEEHYLAEFIRAEYSQTLAELKLQDAPLEYALGKARMIADTKATIAEYENREAVAKFATELKLPREKVHEVIYQIMKASIEMQQRLQMMQMKLSEHQQMKLIDLNTQIESWKHRLQFGLEAKGGLTDHKRQQIVREYLDEAYQLKEKISGSELPEETRVAMMEYHDSVINHWRKQLGV